MPYDIERLSNMAKASMVRKDPVIHQNYILPEFLPYLRRTVTIFGAESVGKSTTALMVGLTLRAKILTEWARPYLETVGPEITVEKMERIQEGQSALQEMGRTQKESIYTIQDTDLFSTVGYWILKFGYAPGTLLDEARKKKSDLYVILSSDIPFEPDPLRYGGDKRESTDQDWIALCKSQGLPYVYITDTTRRPLAVLDAIEAHFKNPLEYQRIGRQYEERSV